EFERSNRGQGELEVAAVRQQHLSFNIPSLQAREEAGDGILLARRHEHLRLARPDSHLLARLTGFPSCRAPRGSSERFRLCGCGAGKVGRLWILNLGPAPVNLNPYKAGGEDRERGGEGPGGN